MRSIGLTTPLPPTTCQTLQRQKPPPKITKMPLKKSKKKNTPKKHINTKKRRGEIPPQKKMPRLRAKLNLSRKKKSVPIPPAWNETKRNRALKPTRAISHPLLWHKEITIALLLYLSVWFYAPRFRVKKSFKSTVQKGKRTNSLGNKPGLF